MTQRNWLIRGGTVITPDETIEDGTVVLYNGRIAYVGPEDSVPEFITSSNGTDVCAPGDLPVVDAAGGYIAPGYIDIHVHGGGGEDTMNASVDALTVMAKAHAAHGTTGFLPTTMTAPHEQVVAAARTVKECMGLSAGDDWQGARVLGMHMEGPYINPSMIGAQNPAFVRPADISELEELYGILGDGFRLITLAPEQPGADAAIEWLVERNIAIAMGHTAATYEQALWALNRGVRQATHSYNAMTGLHHRKPGVVGAILTDSRLKGQLIADGIHVHPAAMKILAQAKGAEGVCLITDAMEAMGMPDGQYKLGGQTVILKNNECRLESGSLAGSVLTMDRAVAIMVSDVGVELPVAVRMASLTPAESVGLADERGSLTVGKWADVVVLDQDLRCRKTFVEGRLVFDKDAAEY